MNPPDSHRGRRTQATSSSGVSDLSQRFESDWKQALRGGEPPKIEDYLAGAEDVSVPEARARLEEIDRRYRGLLSAETLDQGQTGIAETISVGESVQRDTAAGDPAELAQTVDSEINADETLDEADWQSFSTALPEIAGYEIASELGRGAMGVVYRAHQTALKRVVALKMILAGAQAGPDQLSRFQAEAEAVAQLQHPNIVQIYDVGKHDGLPYFSLEFVQGQSLAAQLDRRPQPPHQSAELVETLARAMHHAHEQGIVHRDLKPGNVLLTLDGVPKITDFGLAKRLEGNSSQTRTGTIVGTPSYMAPEQARGNVHHIGPLADVYALGAILYEMLTGRPPFLGASPIDTVMQVTRDEPVPPTQLAPKIPRDLETICLKCLQKEALRRYATAEQLADDLRRFLESQPILARPISPVGRLWRWCRRNPMVAGLTTTAFLLLVGVAVTLLISNRKISAALGREAAARTRADKSAAAAEAARILAENNEQAARAAEAEAEANAQVASEQTALAVGALRKLVYDVQQQIADRPGMQQLKRQLLKTALDGLDEVARKFEDSTLIDRTAARAHQFMGDAFREAGEIQRAVRQYERLRDTVAALAAANPDDPILAKRNPAIAHLKLAELHELLGDSQTALAHYQDSLELRMQWLELQPDDLAAKESVADSHRRIGRVLSLTGKPEQAKQHHRETVKLLREWVQTEPDNDRPRTLLQGAYKALADVAIQVGETDTATQNYDAFANSFEEAVELSPQSRGNRWNLALGRTWTGDALLLGGQPASAKGRYQQAIDLLSALSQEDPGNARLRRDLSITYYGLGTAELRLENITAAQRAFQECLSIRRELAAIDERNVQAQIDLMMALARCGDHAQAAEIASRLRSESSEESGKLYHIACCYALCAAAVQSVESSPSNAKNALQYADIACEVLQEAVARGFNAVGLIQLDPDLEAIRQRSEYRQVVQNLGR